MNDKERTCKDCGQTIIGRFGLGDRCDACQNRIIDAAIAKAAKEQGLPVRQFNQWASERATELMRERRGT